MPGRHTQLRQFGVLLTEYIRVYHNNLVLLTRLKYNQFKIQIMSCYFFAQIKIKDDKEYQRYIEKAGDIFKKFKGEYLSVDNAPVIIEGQWNYTRAVLIKFKNKDDFNAWYNSYEYQKILKHRLKAADCDTILVKSLDK